MAHTQRRRREPGYSDCPVPAPQRDVQAMQQIMPTGDSDLSSLKESQIILIDQ